MKQIITLASAALMLSACSGQQDGQKAVPGKALFSSFSYEGRDSIYSINQLPDSSSYNNPILPGWYSDPSVCTNGEGDYFLVTSTFCYFPGVPIFHSRDMVNWKQIGHVLNRESQLDNFEGQKISGGIFAPDIAYNKANKTYYMITTNVGAGNFFVKTSDPFKGEWSEPVYLPEVRGIDPSFFFDNDGKAYIVNNDDAPDDKPEYDGHRTVRVVQFDTATEKCVGERKIVVNKGWRPQDKPIWCEGPHIYNVDGTYYLMTAEGGTAEAHSEVIYRGPTPFGPFTPYRNNPILTQRNLDPSRPNAVTCAGHADLVKTDEGDWMAVFLACRPNNEGFENLGRETFLLPVTWTEDGWPVILPAGETVPYVSSRQGVCRDDENTTFGNFAITETFDSLQLDQSWMTLRRGATDLYSLSENPGYLTLECAPVNSTEMGTPAFVTRRLQHETFECGTEMTFVPDSVGQAAGLLVFKDEKHQYFLGRGLDSNNQDIVFVQQITPDGDKMLGTVASPDKATVELKVSSDGHTFNFTMKGNGDGEITVAEEVPAYFTSTAGAWGFTGTTVGPYATSRADI